MSDEPGLPPAIDLSKARIPEFLDGDIHWADVRFDEAETRRFLGDDKYHPLLNAIYRGLGIPTTPPEPRDGD